MEENKIIIQCECGTHLLVVQSEVEYFTPGKIEYANDPQIRYRQEFDLAMFNYGNYSEKPGFWRRLGIAWHIIKTGKMHLDEIIMSPDEAKKLVSFINANMIEGKDDIINNEK